jgi:hypothetical protein
MGISLITIGNHNIDFSSENIEDISIKIQNKLNNMIIKNADSYIKWSQLQWEAFNCDVTPERLKKIEQKKDWTFDIDIDIEEDYLSIDFYGPLYLELSFNKTYIDIWDPPDRYKSWFLDEDIIYRNEWRQYFKTIVNTFGGNKVIYLPHQIMPSSSYLDFQGTFEELENLLLKEFGNSKNNFNEIKEDDFLNDNYIHYFIDKLNDLK